MLDWEKCGRALASCTDPATEDFCDFPGIDWGEFPTRTPC